ncbi:NAD(P)-dependent oxidoreductase [Niastella caeni]|uniref:NAD(P)-dependent oxidoreductase n=1 Tax=Niastella caeni TaxID=2569763 RepID=A0A4S8HGK3_9BACT|nr:NAD(P)-dependent oxidoreductase [Niastella caeni]THU34157.1 NAD(P)-dependent oxidoreductase [Niastella caeni]
MQTIFITGGTGYIGTRLIKALLQTGGYRIKALVREGSAHKLPPGCEVIIGNALDAATYAASAAGADTFIHLVGVPHPSPSKKNAFETIDLVSVQQAAAVIRHNKLPHVIYLSVSQYPGRIMKEYREVRAAGETLLKTTGARCSFIRPWYVLGPGHWWPVMLLPFYGLARLIPATREQSRQQALVTIKQMISTVYFAINHPPENEINIYNVPDIKTF